MNGREWAVRYRVKVEWEGVALRLNRDREPFPAQAIGAVPGAQGQASPRNGCRSLDSGIAFQALCLATGSDHR